MDTAANKAIALRYFSEMVDKRSDRLIEELWTEDCVVHRPEVSATIKGREAFRQAFNRVVGPYSEFKTTIHDLVAESDLVVCHLSHQVVHRGGNWTSRLGSHAEVVTWRRRLQCSAFATEKSLKNGSAGMSLECSFSSAWWHLPNNLECPLWAKSGQICLGITMFCRRSSPYAIVLKSGYKGRK